MVITPPFAPEALVMSKLALPKVLIGIEVLASWSAMVGTFV